MNNLLGTRHGHCQVSLDSDSFWIAGGYSNAEEHGGSLKSGLNVELLFCGYQHSLILLFCLVYQFHRKLGWKKLPDMLRKRHYATCGLVTDNSGRKKIVVMGGGTRQVNDILLDCITVFEIASHVIVSHPVLGQLWIPSTCKPKHGMWILVLGVPLNLLFHSLMSMQLQLYHMETPF